jgi:acyl carrier protein phosphodiesterase
MTTSSPNTSATSWPAKLVTTITMHVTCPVCHNSLDFTTEAAEFWGHIDILDLGCVSVTRPYDAAVEAHLSAHHADGTMLEAIKKRHEHYATYSPGVVERLTTRIGATGA